MFHDYLLKGAYLTIEGNSEENIQISLDKLSEATRLINAYSEWYNENMDSIEKKLKESNYY